MIMKSWSSLKSKIEQKTFDNLETQILFSLMYTPQLSFNRLWNKNGRSNKFAYYLQKLQKEELIVKEGKKYSLTAKGKQRATYINGKTGKVTQKPLLAVAVILKHRGKYLMLQRTKEPFHGFWGFPGGKIEFSNYPLEQAAESLLEDAGLRCQLQLKGIFFSKTYHAGKQLYNHQIFIVKGTEPSGHLLPLTAKGKNKWASRSEILSLKTIPNTSLFLDIVESNDFRYVEADRIFNDSESTTLNIKTNLKL